MGVVEMKDSDAIWRPHTSGGQVFSVENVMSSSKPLTKEQVIEMFPDVFDEGLGLLEGGYHIHLNDSTKPVQHAPGRGQVALRNKIKETLEELHSAKVIQPVSKPTPWISSMLAVPKKNGKIRICLDPKDLNKAILRGNYHIPTIEDIASSWCQSFFRPRCKEWVLVCQIGRGVILSDYFPHALGPLWLV